VAAATRPDLPPTFIPDAVLVLRMKELDKRAKEVCPRSTKRVMFLGMWRCSVLCISGACVCVGGGDMRTMVCSRTIFQVIRMRNPYTVGTRLDVTALFFRVIYKPPRTKQAAREARHSSLSRFKPSIRRPFADPCMYILSREICKNIFCTFCFISIEQ
jgi:hypothetical protein